MTISSRKAPGSARLAVLGLGSNRGESRRVLEEAAAILGKEVLGDIRRAPCYLTAPVGVTDQPPFFNTAVAGFYTGSPEDLLREILRVEAAFGRDRSKERRWGERPLDIDILLLGELVIAQAPVLEIPHPRLRERAFALIPLLDLLPEARDPVTGLPYRAILEDLPPQAVERLG